MAAFHIYRALTVQPSSVLRNGYVRAVVSFFTASCESMGCLPSGVQGIGMMHGPNDPWNDDNAIYDDGEWITWPEINSHLERLEFEARFPDVDVDLVPIFQGLLELAIEYHEMTGRHLQVYGDLGELYGAIRHGLKLHRNYAQGSDGKIGNDFVEVKTITPFKSNDTITLNLKRNFSKVLIVKIDAEFEVHGKLISRKSLPRAKGDFLTIGWSELDDGEFSL